MGRKIFIGIGVVVSGLILILLTAALLNVFGNWVFSQVPFLADLRDKGALGDAMNGLTAPVITLASAVLVYLTFREQNRANENQLIANQEFSEQSIVERYTNTFSEIKNEFEALTLKTTANFSNNQQQVIERRGVNALGKFVEGFNGIYQAKSGHHLMKNLSYVCQELTSLTNEIHQSPLPFSKKQYLLLRINRFFIAKMDYHLSKLQELIVADTDESKPFNNYYRECMQNLRSTVRTVIDPYLPR